MKFGKLGALCHFPNSFHISVQSEMVVDSHQHFWIFDPVRDSWISPDMEVIRKDFVPEDLKPILDDNGVNGCVAVQADQSDAETEFLLHLAEANDFVLGVVGWIDLKDKDLYDRLERYSLYEKLKGFRHIIQAEKDGFMLQPEFISGVRTLSAFDFTYDILVYPHQLKEAYAFAKELPNVRFVLDHIAKPYIKKSEIEPWATDIKKLAELSNISCKLSGMVTEANWENWKSEDFAPYIETVLEAFGTDRTMFGSDWPVCLLGADYKETKGILERNIDKLFESEKAKIMGGNAVKIYGLEASDF